MSSIANTAVQQPYPITGPPSGPQRSQRISTLSVLLAAGCLSSATGSIVAPVFPELIEQLRFDPMWAGILVSTHTLTTALATPLLGILADRIGKLRVLILSLVSYALFGVAGGLMHSFGSMLLVRGLVGAASGGIAAVSIGLLSNMYDGEARSRIMGYATSALATATVIFPILGGWLGSTHWQFAFCLYGLGFPVALAALWIIREQTSHQTATVDLSHAQGLGKSLRHPQVRLLLMALALTSALFYVIVVYAPLYLKLFIGADPILNGGVLAARSIGAAVISALGASRLAKCIGANSTIAVGFLLMAFSLMAIPNVAHPPLIVLTALPFGFGFGLAMPNFYSALANLAPATQRTGLLAIGTGISSLGQFLSPIFFGPIWTAVGPGVFYVSAGVSMAISVLIFSRTKLA